MSSSPQLALLRRGFSEERAEHSCFPGCGKHHAQAVLTLQRFVGVGEPPLGAPTALSAGCVAGTVGIPMTHPHPSQHRGRLMSHQSVLF